MVCRSSHQRESRMIRAIQINLTRLGLILALSLGVNVPPAQAQAPQSTLIATQDPNLHRMLSAMGMYDILEIMSTESINSASDLEERMFPNAGGAAWAQIANALYAPERMTALFEAAFPQDALTPEQQDTLTQFALTDAGARIIAGEIAARRTFLDASAIDTAIDAFIAAVEANDPRLEILAQLNATNGLVERNVMGALNLRLVFYTGLMDGGAFDRAIPESAMLADVWAQEPEVRRTTVEWLYAFQLLAYGDVTNAELEGYVALSETPAGRAVNAALFAAFDAMLAELSYDIGAAAATFIGGDDI